MDLIGLGVLLAVAQQDCGALSISESLSGPQWPPDTSPPACGVRSVLSLATPSTCSPLGRVSSSASTSMLLVTSWVPTSKHVSFAELGPQEGEGAQEKHKIPSFSAVSWVPSGTILLVFNRRCCGIGLHVNPQCPVLYSSLGLVTQFSEPCGWDRDDVWRIELE